MGGVSDAQSHPIMQGRPVDEFGPCPELSRERQHTGFIWHVDRVQVDLGPAGVVQRDIIDHTGAVGVVALDDHDRVLMIKQYRHPVGYRLWEVPAGLCDEPGEPPYRTAARELAEEADMTASEWYVLAEWFNTPGGSDEANRIYLARGVAMVPEAQRHARRHEEADMETAWVPLDDAVASVLAGDLHNPSAVIGILAAHAAKLQGWTPLRPVDTPWPAHKAFR